MCCLKDVEAEAIARLRHEAGSDDPAIGVRASVALLRYLRLSGHIAKPIEHVDLLGGPDD